MERFNKCYFIFYSSFYLLYPKVVLPIQTCLRIEAFLIQSGRKRCLIFGKFAQLVHGYAGVMSSACIAVVFISLANCQN